MCWQALVGVHALISPRAKAGLCLLQQYTSRPSRLVYYRASCEQHAAQCCRFAVLAGRGLRTKVTTDRVLKLPFFFSCLMYFIMALASCRLAFRLYLDQALLPMVLQSAERDFKHKTEM